MEKSDPNQTNLFWGLRKTIFVVISYMKRKKMLKKDQYSPKTMSI